jgi:triacylglycerol lipase
MKWTAFFALLVPLTLIPGDCAASSPLDEPAARPTVVLLHGLARSAASMHDMQVALEGAGYRVCNIDYPSREHRIADLAANFVAPSIARCMPDGGPVNFVTHSLGGIVVRELAKAKLIPSFGRVVMLGPPNHGSEVVDSLGGWSLFRAINGPAGGELGTKVDSTPQRLGPATFQAGVIAGSSTINWINSLIIPGVDDGKVSVESAKLEGMQDFVVIKTSHPFLMKDDGVIKQVVRFLASGCFVHDEKAAPLAGVPACIPITIDS